VARAVAASAAVAEVLVARGALAETGALFRRQLAGSACLMADERGWAAAGREAEAVLAAAGIATRRHVIAADPRPKPTLDLAKALHAVLRPGETPVAIGSGVINDVVKHAAFAAGMPYLCVATAASMDGYASAGAPLSDQGFKKTIACRPARAILADLDVIADAPREMNGWGYGDLCGKLPAGADWMIADALGIEPIDPGVWDMVQGGLPAWLDRPERIAAAEPEAIGGLFRGLILVGLSMERHGSSRPASGADHQIAHLWEMADLHHNAVPVSHGASVAVGCVTTLRLYDWLLERDLSRLDPVGQAGRARSLDRKAADITAAFGAGEVAARALAETRAKHLEGPALADRLRRLALAWPRLRQRLRSHLPRASEMAGRLSAAGAPAEAAAIGVSRDGLRAAILKAGYLRRRYTVLDLLDECGLLAQAAAAALPALAAGPAGE